MKISPYPYPENFIKRRAAVWIPVAVCYASYYMCRYNLPLVSKTMCDYYGWSKTQWGSIITAMMWAYAAGQLINGPLTDMIKGRRAMLLGAAATVILNILFGMGVFIGSITWFVSIWLLNGYFQAFGAPSGVKIFGNWFGLRERGIYTGYFGLVMKAGRFAIQFAGPYLILRYGWPFLFWLPAAVAAAAAVLVYFKVEDTPEEAGFPELNPYKNCGAGEKEGGAALIKKILSSKPLWLIAGAYFCTGVVRHGLDQWFPRYFEEVQAMPLTSFIFQASVWALPVAGTAGAFLAGYSSDIFFSGRRGPICAIMYFAQFLLLIAFLKFTGPVKSMVFFILLQAAISGPHALLGAAAAMDFGGKTATGSAVGFVDFWQYLGGGLTGVGLGLLLDRFGWGGWIVSLLGFSFAGGVLMLALWNELPKPSIQAVSLD